MVFIWFIGRCIVLYKSMQRKPGSWQKTRTIRKTRTDCSGLPIFAENWHRADLKPLWRHYSCSGSCICSEGDSEEAVSEGWIRSFIRFMPRKWEIIPGNGRRRWRPSFSFMRSWIRCPQEIRSEIWCCQVRMRKETMRPMSLPIFSWRPMNRPVTRNRIWTCAYIKIRRRNWRKPAFELSQKEKDSRLFIMTTLLYLLWNMRE